MTPVPPNVITTRHLLLRPWAAEDISDLLAYAGDEEWGRYLPTPVPYEEADARAFVEAQMREDRTMRPSWAIEQSGRVVGGVNLTFVHDRRAAEIGYSVARAAWGKGVATE